MPAIAQKADPTLWDKVKTKVTAEAKGGKPGQWSARKAQLAVGEYKAAGGRYKGKKSPGNHLSQWTGEAWGTKSGAQSGKTGERYLPQRVRDSLSDADYQRSTAKKRSDTAKGKQVSPQPKDVARKTAATRHGTTRAVLLQQAAKRGIKGRSRMTKAALQEALQARS
jgi:hypothetical protein